MMADAEDDLAWRFEHGRIDPAAFGHVDHVEVAYAMLSKYDFIEACARYAATIKSMAESVGASKKFNATTTIAFMSLIAERKARSGNADFNAFLASNQDLLDRDVLMAWYSHERLASDRARCQFLLPDKIPSTRK